MSTYLKPVLVFIVSFLIFAGAASLADRELLDFIQTHFYNPSVVNSYVKENTRDAEIAQSHIFDLQNKFALALNEPAVRSSFHHNQNAEDIYERSRIFGMLLESTSGLLSVQFVDSNGIRIHFSTSPLDIISRSQESASYRNYTEDLLALPFDVVSVPANGSARFTMDEQGERIIFSYPFTDSMDVHRGTALFNVSVKAFSDRFIAEGRLRVNDDVSVVSSPPGIFLGSPGSSKAEITGNVSQVWEDGGLGRITLDTGDSGVQFSLISYRTGHGIFFGRLVNDALFYISDSMRNILYLSMFLTFYLALFFLVNFRPNSVTVVRNRIKHLKNNLFEQLYVNQSSQERAKWLLELEQRRDEIHMELKGGLKMTRRTEKSIDGIIDKEWDELLAIMKTGSDISSPEMPAKTAAVKADEADSIEEIGEAVDELEEIEEVEEIDEVGEAEDIDEFEEIEEVGELDEAGEAEELDEVEEIEEVEELNEIEEVEVAEELNEIEETGELDEIDDHEEPFAPVLSAEPPDDEAIFEQEEAPKVRRGLLALASEIEFNRSIIAGTDEEEADIDIMEIDIVSPFSSMFSSLEEEKNETV